MNKGKIILVCAAITLFASPIVFVAIIAHGSTPNGPHSWQFSNEVGDSARSWAWFFLIIGWIMAEIGLHLIQKSRALLRILTYTYLFLMGAVLVIFKLIGMMGP